MHQVTREDWLLKRSDSCQIRRVVSLWRKLLRRDLMSWAAITKGASSVGLLIAAVSLVIGLSRYGTDERNAFRFIEMRSLPTQPFPEVFQHRKGE
jgi:hypothetical protein